MLSVTNITKLEGLHRAASRAITGCLSSYPKPLLLSEASSFPLRVTLTDFTLSSYKRALRLPISFPISGLARLEVKPKLSSCSRSVPSLSRQGAALAHLDSFPPYDLVLWTDGSVPFLLARAAPAYLPTAFSVALRPLQQAQYAQVFLLKPAPFCMLFAGLAITDKSAISLLFSSCLTLVLSSPRCPLLHLSFYLKLSGRSGKNCLLSLPLLSYYNGSPNTRFSRGTTQLMSWSNGERYLRPLQSLVVSLLFAFLELDAQCLI